MPEPTIRVAGLEKTFRVPVREAGLGAAVRSLFKREHRDFRGLFLARWFWRFGLRHYSGASA